MCFFKQLASPPTFQRALDDPFAPFAKEFGLENSSDSDFSTKSEKIQMKISKPDVNAMLMNCLGLINFNSQMMFAMDQVLLTSFRN